MKDVITMWRNTRMVVLTAVIAAVYAAVLIPFKIALPIVPGFTEIRPANVIPIICSLMFGPAAAWGAAFGNLIGDFFGTLTLGSIFGFFGNFLYGLIPYKLWQALTKSEPKFEAGFKKNSALSGRYFLIVLISCAACGTFIGWGAHLLGLLPFPILGNIIVINNFLAAIVLGPILLPGLYRIVKPLGLIYTDVMYAEPSQESEVEKQVSRYSIIGGVLVIVGALGALILGNLIAVGVYELPFLQPGEVSGQAGLGLALLPFIVLIIIGCFII